MNSNQDLRSDTPTTTDMPAVVLTADRRIVLERRIEPTLQPDEVLVDVDLCGVCGSDLHAPSLTEMYLGGCTMGHELSGRIRAVGGEVDGWREGQRVSVNPNGNVCGVCEWCQQGRYNFCVQATRETAIGLQRNGGLAPLLATKPATLRALPDTMGRIEAAWVEPAATALRAVRLGGDLHGKTALVTGGGPIGQLACRILRTEGAAHVYLVEPSPIRRQFGLQSHADVVLHPDDAFDVRPDIVIEASGSPRAAHQALELLTPGGTLVVVGAGDGSGLDPLSILLKEIVVRGSFTYNTEFDEVIPMLADGRLTVADLTTAILPIEDTLSALETLRDAQTMKVLIEPRNNTEGARP